MLPSAPDAAGAGVGAALAAGAAFAAGLTGALAVLPVSSTVTSYIPMPVRECVVIETDDYNVPTPAARAAKKRLENQSAARTDAATTEASS